MCVSCPPLTATNRTSANAGAPTSKVTGWATSNSLQLRNTTASPTAPATASGNKDHRPILKPSDEQIMAENSKTKVESGAHWLPAKRRGMKATAMAATVMANTPQAAEV